MPDGDIDYFYIRIGDWLDYYESAHRVIAQVYKGNLEDFPVEIIDNREKFYEWVREEEAKMREKSKPHYDNIAR